MNKFKMPNIPAFGWKVKLDHAFPETRKPNRIPRSIYQLLQTLPATLRFASYIFRTRRSERLPFYNPFNPVVGKQIYGAPVGGLGGGTIGRGFKGEFCRYQLIPGIYSYNVVPANQFIINIQNEKDKTLYQQVLSPLSGPANSLTCWRWKFPGSDAKYSALYPRAWTEYNIPQQKVRLICRQISPVIPHNYKDSSVPGAAFIWNIENNNDETRKVSITFTFKNGTGDEEDKSGSCWSESFSKKNVHGVLIHQTLKGMPCTYGIAAAEKDGSTVSWLTKFDPNSDGSRIWHDLCVNGQLSPSSSNEDRPATNPGQELASAVCVRTDIPNHSVCQLEMALVWDMPKIHFANQRSEYERYYKRWFREEGNCAPQLCHYVLKNYGKWEREIEKWQQPILNDRDLPDWYKSALFNELYVLGDGGTVWVTVPEAEKLAESDPRREYGLFGYLESHESIVYNAYDAHFYASFALVMLWPMLQESLQYEIRDAIGHEDHTKHKVIYSGKKVPRKVMNTVPHDLGTPDEDPFVTPNSSLNNDASAFKDLSLKFVLQCYRDYIVIQDICYVRDMWPKVKQLMRRAMAWDEDCDGLIENNGLSDQSYDKWTMRGTSAYCGGLWLAALLCAKKLAELAGDMTEAECYHLILQKGLQSFEDKLWNGEYYNFDSSKSLSSKVIMSDQLCGHWYLHASQIHDKTFNELHVKRALKKIFDYNVMKFKNGTMGAVNGMTPKGQIAHTSPQSEEVSTGTVYGLSALMIHEGMVEEAFKTSFGLYNTVYNVIGMGFETPETLSENKYYRSVGCMRPLSIWGIQNAWEMHKKRHARNPSKPN